MKRVGFESRFNSLVALCVILSIAGFFTAEGDAGFGVVAVGLSIAAWRWTRPPGGVKLPRWLVSGAIVLAVLYALFDAAANGAAVSSVCRLISVIQVIKFFDPRTARDYAQRVLLSIFLAIGAVLTSNQLSMGLFAVVFLPLAIATVIHYQIFAGMELAAAARAAAGLPTPAPAVLLRGQRAQLLRVLVASTAGVLTVAAGVFVMMPRGIGANALGNWGRPSGAVTGFTDQVKLGRAGLLSESSRIVLDLVVKESDGTLLGSQGNTYHLRGAVLDRYDPDRRVWSRSSQTRERYDRDSAPNAATEVSPRPVNRALVEQTITLRGALDKTWMHLFTSWKPVMVRFEDDSDLSFGADDLQLQRHGPSGALRYRVWSLPVMPSGAPTERSLAGFDNPRIEALAREILADTRIDPDPQTRPVAADAAAARAIESYLHSNYSYTLEMVAPTDGLDPIEYFLFQSRRGHCEYFASAMAALCRSVGVPARVITGYLASEYDNSGGRYIVRESDAHAWVEAEAGVGRWRVYDPTPPSALEQIHQSSQGLLSRFRRLYDSIGYAWINSVVTYDGRPNRSPSSLSLGPVADYLQNVSNSIRERGAAGIASAALRAAVAFAGVAVAGYAAWFVLRWTRRTPRASRSSRAARTLYAEFLRIAKRRGWPKPPWQPPLLHARALSGSDPEFGALAMRLAGAYYAVRFGGAPIDRAAEASLRHDLRAWRGRP